MVLDTARVTNIWNVRCFDDDGRIGRPRARSAAGRVNLQGAATMGERSAEHGVKNTERRLTAVEQILPTLATKTDLAAAVDDLGTEIQTATAPLATRAEVRAEIQTATAPLATKAEVRTEIQAAIAPLATKAEVRAEIQAAIAPLATKAEVRAEIQAAIAPLATKIEVRAEIQTAIAPLATQAEVAAVKTELYAAIRAEGVETRRHFDVVAEGMHADVRMLAEGIVAVQARCDTRHHDVMGTLHEHDRRLTRLEALPSKDR
jgi:hypothetical protein